DDPLVLLLVVPEPFGRGVAVRDDPLDADAIGVEQGGEKLVGKVVGKVSEEIGGHGSHHRSSNAFRGSRPASVSSCQSLKNLPACHRRWVSAAHLLTTSSYSPAPIISRATSAPRIRLQHWPHVSPSWSASSS